MITLYTHSIILSTLILRKRQKKGCRKEKTKNSRQPTFYRRHYVTSTYTLCICYFSDVKFFFTTDFIFCFLWLYLKHSVSCFYYSFSISTLAPYHYISTLVNSIYMLSYVVLPSVLCCSEGIASPTGTKVCMLAFIPSICFFLSLPFGSPTQSFGCG